MLGLGLGPNPTVQTTKSRPLGFVRYGPKLMGPHAKTTKLDALETIDSNPKTKLLMTICLSQMRFERARCTVTSATPLFFIRNQDSNAPRRILHAYVFQNSPFQFKAHFVKQVHNSPRKASTSFETHM